MMRYEVASFRNKTESYVKHLKMSLCQLIFQEGKLLKVMIISWKHVHNFKIDTYNLLRSNKKVKHYSRQYTSLRT
jgi:hypothetical protein